LEKNIYKYEVRSIDGKLLSLSKFEGRVMLVVNVASNCGFTSQYSSLQKLYEEYKDQGLSILAFPCNDFGAQEPGANKDIKFFCHNSFNVTFDLFSKTSVLGPQKLDLYQYLYDFGLEPQGVGGFRSKIFKLVKWLLYRIKGVWVPERNEAQWNFHKFLIGKNGIPVASFLSEVTPDSNILVQKVEEELRK
jgi:glutathione peroxidase